MGKVRRVDFYPDEFLSGVDGLSPEEVGAYWLVCSKIYSRGDGLPDDDRENARIFRLDPRTWKRLKGALIAKNKLQISNTTIINSRCIAELVKAHKRIDDAQRAGAEGGRPPTPTAPTSPEIPPTVTPTIGEPLPQLEPNRSQIVGDKSPHDLNGNNDVAKAAGLFSEKLTSNHQPPTTKEEEKPSPPQEKSYAFLGKIIRLTAADFQKWGAEFRETIPDLMAQLADDDAYYDRTLTGKDRMQWFHRLHRKLLRVHQEVLRGRAKSPGPNLNESW